MLHMVANFVKKLLSKIVNLFIHLLLLFFFILAINPLLDRWYGVRINLLETLKQHGVAVEKLGQTTIPSDIGEALKQIKSAIYLTQEYPSSQGYNYLQSINLKDKPAVVTWQENEQPFWVGIANMMLNRNYRNPTLFLNFKDKVDVRVDPKGSVGWVEMEPDSQYFIKLNGDLQPLVTYRLNPLFVKFANEGDYSVHFGIRGDNELPVDGDFIIKVKK